MPDVFISYASDERQAVKPIAEAFEKLGLDVWFDQKLKIGNHWDNEIEQQLKASLAVVVCWSPVAVTSEWVKYEATIAHQMGTLAPIYIKNCSAPGPLARIQGIQLVDWNGETSDEAWRQLLDRLETILKRDDLITTQDELDSTRAPSESNIATPGFAYSEVKQLYGGILDSAEAAEIRGRHDFRGLDIAAAQHSSNAEASAFWIDFSGNSAGRFPAAFCVPYLLAMDEISLSNEGLLPHGNILVLGGGQADPNQTAGSSQWMIDVLCRWAPFYSIRRHLLGRRMPKLYEQQTIQHFAEANTSPYANSERKLFAIPGKGDNYDGLVAFDNLFCSARKVSGNIFGDWQCAQHRSYWHMRLPFNWWIWGVDLAFDDVFDNSQVDYFEAISEEMGQDDKIILMVSEPLWLRANEHRQDDEENLFKVALLATRKNVRICAIVASGDAHYNRYYAKDIDTHFVTSGGGGGAYLDPTHVLKNDLSVSWPENVIGPQVHNDTLVDDYKEGIDEEPASTTEYCVNAQGNKVKEPEQFEPTAYPGKLTSSIISLKSLLLPFYQPLFCAVLGAYYAVAALLAPEDLANESIDALLSRLFAQPEIETVLWLVWLALGTVILIAYSQLQPYTTGWSKLIGKIVVGISHATAHFSAGAALVYAMKFIPLDAFCETSTCFAVAHWGVFTLFAALVAGFILGTYWIIMMHLVGSHSKEPFAALGIASHRNFLKFKFETDKLTIFPLGVAEPPRQYFRANRQGNPQSSNSLRVPSPPIEVLLIEPPIVIYTESG